MIRTARVALGAALVVVATAGAGTVYSSQAESAPVVGPVASAPAALVAPALPQPVPSTMTDAVGAARTALDDIESAEAARAAAAAARPRYTCEPEADARVVDNIIVNKDCPALNAAKERAQREYATSGEAQYDYYVNGPGAAEIASQNALRACREQTGMTTEQCRADAAAGNAS